MLSTLKVQILRLRESGSTYNEIVRELGCSKGTVSYYCGEAQKEKAARRKRDSRSTWRKAVQEYKQTRGCKDCGEMYPYWVLEFDHLEGKSFNVSEVAKASSLEALMLEVSKCDVVCANCHRLRSHQRQASMSSLDVYDISSHYGRLTE